MSESSSESGGDEEHVETTKPSFKLLPASVRKLKRQGSDSPDDFTSEEEDCEKLEGVRLMDISSIASIFKYVSCPL